MFMPNFTSHFSGVLQYKRNYYENYEFTTNKTDNTDLLVSVAVAFLLVKYMRIAILIGYGVLHTVSIWFLVVCANK
jgi:hypothetical protein